MSKLINKTGVYVLPRQDGTLHWIEFMNSEHHGNRVRFLYDHRPKKRDTPFIAVARIEENIDGTWKGCAMHDARMLHDENQVKDVEFQDYATEEEAKIACLAAYLLTYGKEDT